MVICKILCFFFLLPAVYAQQNDTIYWSKQKLDFDDFRQTESSRSVSTFESGRRRILQGYLNCGISLQYEMNGNTVRWEVKAFMVPNTSWLADKSNHEVLRHEQAHFSITEVYARKLRKTLSKAFSYNEGQRAYHRLISEMERTQRSFDKDHTGEAGVSEKWSHWIERNLEELNEFSDQMIVLQKQ